MSFGLPNKGGGDNDIQAVLYAEYLKWLYEGLRGNDFVLIGGAATGTAGMNVAIADVSVVSNGVMFFVTGANAAIGTADATNPRLDVVVVNSAGALATRAGTAAAVPVLPTLSANDVPLCVVYVPANDTVIATSQIKDLRLIRDTNVTIWRLPAPYTANTTAAAIQLLNGSSLTIQPGLWVNDKILRVRLGGTILYNSGTPTGTLTIKWGSTTMFADVSGASTNDTDRAPFFLDLQFVCSATSTQYLVGSIVMGQIAAKTAPTTGMGDAWSTANTANAIRGTSSINNGSSNGPLEITFTFSVSNAANEITVETATIELV